MTITGIVPIIIAFGLCVLAMLATGVRAGRLFGEGFVLYIVIGVVIAGLRLALAGPCPPGAPATQDTIGFAIDAGIWPSTAYRELWVQNRSLRSFIAPGTCNDKHLTSAQLRGLESLKNGGTPAKH